MKKGPIAVLAIVAFVIIVIAVLYFTKSTKKEDSSVKTFEEKKQDALGNDKYQKIANTLKKYANNLVSKNQSNFANNEASANGTKLGLTYLQISKMSIDDIIKLLVDKSVVAV